MLLEILTENSTSRRIFRYLQFRLPASNEVASNRYIPMTALAAHERLSFQKYVNTHYTRVMATILIQ
jgi:hypothetical protein